MILLPEQRFIFRNTQHYNQIWGYKVASQSDLETQLAAVTNALTTTQASLAKAKPGSPEQTQLSIAVFDLKKQQASLQQQLAKPTDNTEKSSSGENKVTDDGRLAGNKFAESTKATKGDANSKINGPGKRTWNPLGDFSSYTYRISLYALPPDAYNSYKQSGQWDRTQLALICQSGGAANDEKLDASRGKGFELDYYIDDLEIVSNINSKEVGMATNSLSFKFKIKEPYGLTFPTKLIELQKDLKTKSKISSPVSSFVEAQHGIFLLSIRFYGYDEDGNIVTSAKYNNGSLTKNLDESATFERSFTIFLTKMNFKLEGKGAVYDIDCRIFDQQVGNGVKRSVLDQPPKAIGSTVKEMIGGSSGTSTGLLDILNQQQQEFKNKKLCEIPDVYAVEYEKTSKIKDSRMVDSGDVNKTRVAMTTVKKPAGSNARSEASPAADSFKVNRTIQFSKGATILTAIDQIITQSSYVDDALTELDKEEAPAQENGPTSDPNANPKTLQWYMINPNVEILGYDHIRKDFAYKITYVIQSYDVPYVQSANIKQVPRYPGPHKIYNYFYTGKNSEVISYDQSYNNLFFLYAKMSAAGQVSNGDIISAPIQPKPSNNADPVGKPSGKDEGAASIKSFLYSPEDQRQAKIKILGDPDFLMPVTSGTIGQMLEKWYGPDFTINPNSGQVFIEVLFNQVEDYDHADGLLTPNGNIETNGFNTYAGNSMLNSVVKGTVFMVMRVISKFSQGKFIQEFETRLPPYFKSESDNTNRTSAANSGSAKDNSGDREKKTDPKKELPKTSKQALEQLKSSVRVKPTTNDDQLLAPVGTYANAGRETTGVNPITGAKSIMFKK